MSIDRVREQLKTRRGGADDARLFCVVFDRIDKGGRDFRLPNEQDYDAVRAAEQELTKKVNSNVPGIKILPEEPTPQGGGQGAGRAFSQKRYGMETFNDLFTRRQALALSIYVDLVREYTEQINKKDKGLAEAVNGCLALLVDRLADLNASLCVWQLNTPNTAHVFGRWVLQVVWDFGEINPLAGAGGSPESAIKRMLAILRDLQNANLLSGNVEKLPAQSHILPDNSAQIFITDPPYYDAVPYSDLLDFFYVWLKRTLSGSLSRYFDEEVGPKAEECIVDEIKGKDHIFFEDTMKLCFIEAKRVLNPSGIGIIVFAHKSTSGWESLVQAIIDSGWTITGSWPIDTEMGSRLRAKQSAALASSVHLVCRPRNEALRQDEEIGEWRDVLTELPVRIRTWMPRLASEGIVGADAIFACIGPALEIYSRFDRVEKASGEKVPLRDYLEQVWATVSNEALSVIFTDGDAQVTEPEARLTAMWLWTIGAGSDGKKNSNRHIEDDRESKKNKPPVKSTGFSLEYDAARKIAQGLGVHLEKASSVVEVKGETARLLPVIERTRYLFGKDSELETGRRRRTKNVKQLSLFNELEEAEGVDAEELNMKGPTPGSTVLDRVHQAMILFGAGRGEALRRFLVQEGIGKDDGFWKLAQALSALYPPEIEEKRWVDGVLARKRGLGF